ncbi:hypothetical protein [Deinococcus hopiensis]|uniref:Uncharacterized protein n=1 Tax=Deinococcus hopiensis KR-140 TaxID=695939 RepID=A0A1W1VCW4_9DEIO|nr:hypothetical protein [Deinococcus hopiensis]SMB90794.1 hypothetical protein SAMN00790413_00895 [Deinococcus hopiensis KR-140]
MTRSRIDPLFALGAAVTLVLLVLAWPHLPTGERGALLPTSVSPLVAGVLVARMGGLERQNPAMSDAAAQALALQAAIAAALAFGGDLLRALGLATGVMLTVTGNATARARPGEWFGFRARSTLLPERAWSASQRRTAPALVVPGTFYTVFAPLLLPWINPPGGPAGAPPSGGLRSQPRVPSGFPARHRAPPRRAWGAPPPALLARRTRYVRPDAGVARAVAGGAARRPACPPGWRFRRCWNG